MKPIKIVALSALAIAVILAVVFLGDSASDKSAEKRGEIKYAADGTAILIIGDNNFISKINDIYINSRSYYGRHVEIEGFLLTKDNDTLVARYGPGCCMSDEYAYLRYKYDEEVDLDLTEISDWIKVKGVLKRGHDGQGEYVYIEATSVEKMSTRGKDTVTQ